MPLPEKEEKASFASFWANTITRNAAEGDKLIAAAKWIDFLSSAGVQQQWTPAVGELPARQALASDPALMQDEKLAPFIESLEYSYATFMVNEADLRQAVAGPRPGGEAGPAPRSLPMLDVMTSRDAGPLAKTLGRLTRAPATVTWNARC